MLPSVGLCLNASKAESALDRRWRRYIWESRVPKGEYSLCDYARRLFLTVSRRVVPRRVLCRNGCDQGLKHLKLRPPACSRPRVFRSRDSESFVDDLRTWRGVVSGRAVITLRSVKTLPSAWEIRECGFTSLPAIHSGATGRSTSSRNKKRKSLLDLLYLFFFIKEIEI